MNFFLILVIAVGLAMDAFAVSISLGIRHPKYRMSYALKIAFMFGFFQAFMPIAGWVLGDQFRVFITSYDHWVAFIILFFIGGKMVYQGLKPSEDNNGDKDCDSFKLLLTLSVATSLDALAVGISFAFLKVNIWTSAAIIGVVTFIISFIGAELGDKIGGRFKNKAEVFGGVILLLIGSKILLEHLFSK